MAAVATEQIVAEFRLCCRNIGSVTIATIPLMCIYSANKIIWMKRQKLDQRVVTGCNRLWPVVTSFFAVQVFVTWSNAMDPPTPTGVSFFQRVDSKRCHGKKKFRDHLCRSKCPFFENVANVVFSETSPGDSEDEIGRHRDKCRSSFFRSETFSDKRIGFDRWPKQFFSDCSKLRRRLCLFRRKAVNCETGFTGWKTERN